MLYTQLVTSQPLKTIQLPFNGLYNSFIGTALDSELESYTYDMADDKAELVYSITYNIDNQKYNNAITKEYADYLNHAINEEYKTDITFLNVSYEPMNGQNRGDNLWTDIDANTLPSIDKIADIIGVSIDDVWQGLADIAADKLTSRSGFSSFYPVSIEPLKNVNYDKWNDVYITILLEYISLNLAGNYEASISGIELEFLEQFNGNGGCIELAYNCLSNEDADKLSDLLAE